MSPDFIKLLEGKTGYKAVKKERKRQRFNVKALERYEFVDYIINDLKERCELNIIKEFARKHLKFYQATIEERRKRKKIAIVGYGGSGKDLRELPTPLQTELLPEVFGYWDRASKGNKKFPLLILGHSFDEVFLRKMRLLNSTIPDLRLIQYINVNRLQSLDRRSDYLRDQYDKVVSKGKIENEVYDFQSAIVDYFQSDGELNGKKYYVLDVEVPAGEGTIKSEVIDILALERKTRWLTVIELKFEKLNDSRLQSSIFQGLDYCNWVEEHKEGLAMLFRKHNIVTRRRIRLILINGPHKFPEFHKRIAQNVSAKDKYQEIELYYANNSLPLNIYLFNKNNR